MPILLGPELAVWCELLAVLAIGTSVAVALAAFVSRRVRSAVWERAVWQACTLTLLALVALELTGTWELRRCDCASRAGARFAAIARLKAWHLHRSPDDRAGIETPSQLAEKGRIDGSLRRFTPGGRRSSGASARSGILGRMVWSRALLAVFWWRCKSLARCRHSKSRAVDCESIGPSKQTIRPLTSNSLRSPAVFHWLFPVLALPSRFSEEL